MLVSLSRAFDTDSVELLLFLDAMKGVAPCTLNGLYRFARLLSSGLVQEVDGYGYGGGQPGRLGALNTGVTSA